MAWTRAVALGEEVGDGGDPAGDRGVGQVAEADHQLRRFGDVIGAVSAHWGELSAALSASGFTDVRVSSERALLRFTDPEQWWRWLLTGGGRAAVQALDRKTRARFQEAAFERIRDIYERGAPEFDEEALLAVAKKPRV